MAREEQIRFQNEGQWLYGMLHLPEGPDRAPGIIMVHGFTGHRIESHGLFVKAARALATAGVAALRFDCRGSGESEGEFCDMTVAGEVADARAALDVLAARPELDPERLGVLGLSLGACVSACLAGSDPRVQALVLWSPTALILSQGLPSFVPADAPQQISNQGWFDHGGNRVGLAFVRGLADVRPLEAARMYAGPALVVYGTADALVSPENPQAYLDALPGPKEYITVKGADHTFSSCAWEAQVIEATVSWFGRVWGTTDVKPKRET